MGADGGCVGVSDLHGEEGTRGVEEVDIQEGDQCNPDISRLHASKVECQASLVQRRRCHHLFEVSPAAVAIPTDAT